jgi:hypothetical protein
MVRLTPNSGFNVAAQLAIILCWFVTAFFCVYRGTVIFENEVGYTNAKLQLAQDFFAPSVPAFDGCNNARHRRMN